MLWFAWKIVLLQYHKHRLLTLIMYVSSCDLLEKSYFCSITNIYLGKGFIPGAVVICLKNRTFAVSQTSSRCLNTSLVLLWFAWKIVLLQYHKHPAASKQSTRVRCDLLEKSYFCSITNIITSNQLHVNQLWFAWKIVLLQYHKHLVIEGEESEPGCDLLEKSYFCSITNIWIGAKMAENLVVICLKNRTFAVSQTSKYKEKEPNYTLWFAWKIVLLQYHKHQSTILTITSPRCDLLEKSYFCSITNIPSSSTSSTSAVVICLKNRTFAVSQTSQYHPNKKEHRLWFAWKIVLLQYHKHHYQQT